jgi:virulence factor lipase-like protein
MLKRALHFLTFSLVGLLVIGCSSLDTLDTPPVPSNNPVPFPGFTFPLLDLANSQIPLPNDLLRNPTTGLLNFPGTGEPFDAANSLDGFSTSGAIIIPFRGTVVTESVTNETLTVYNTTTGQPAPCTFSFSSTPTGTVVTAVPIFALDDSTTYIVVISNRVISALSNSPVLSDNVINILKQTDPLVDGNGNSTNAALDNETAATLEAVRIGYQAIWQGAEQLTNTNRADIPLAFAFTTETLFEALPQARNDVTTANAGLVNALPNVPVAHGQVEADRLGTLPLVPEFFAALPAPGNRAPNADIWEIYTGTVQSPIYRIDAAEGFWSNPPVQAGNQSVTFLLFLPNTPGPDPALIFQHGITGSKEQSVALANAVNGNGLGLIAIDLELHGDLKADPAASDGDGFINIPNLRNSRDNIRQSVVNLYALNNAIVTGQTDLTNDMVPELAPGPGLGGVNPVYISLSLGSIVGDLFHATEPNLTASALNVGGARITNLLLSSETFSGLVIDGLAANGVVQGTPQFAQFFIIAQAVIDDADPVNYADQAITGTLRGGTPAQILQQVNVTDAVVPPSSQYDMAIQHAHGVASPAFSQVDALLPTPLAPQVSSPYAGPGFYEIPNAGHGAILDPSAGPTVQIVTQALTYLGSALTGGTGTIIDSGIRARQIPVEILESGDYSGVVKF